MGQIARGSGIGPWTLLASCQTASALAVPYDLPYVEPYGNMHDAEGAMRIEGMEEVRSSLPTIVAELRERPFGQVVHFGRQRRDEAVVLSSAEYARLAAAARQLEELERLGALRLASERLDDGRFSEGTVDELFAAADTAPR